MKCWKSASPYVVIICHTPNIPYFLAHVRLLSHFVIARNKAGKSLVHNLVQPKLRHVQILAAEQQCLWL